VVVQKVEKGGGRFMMPVTIHHFLAVAALVFTIGIFGIFLNRKNVIIISCRFELICWR